MLSRKLSKVPAPASIHTEFHRFWKVETVRSTSESTMKEIMFTIDGVDTALTPFTKFDLSTGSRINVNHGSFDSLFDGIIPTSNTGFYSRGSGNIIAAIDLGEPKCVTEVLLSPQGSNTSTVYNVAKELRFYYSDDNVNWTQTPIEYINLAQVNWRGSWYKRFATGL